MTRPAELSVRLESALAPGGVAVVRLSGDGVGELLQRTCRRPHSNEPPRFAPGRLTHCRLFDDAQPLDDVIVAHDEQGGAEICLHGGVRVAQRALMLCQRLGARRIDPAGGATADFGLDVAAAVDAILPRATTRTAARWLLRQRSILAAFLNRLLGRSSPAVDAAERAEFHLRSAAAIRAIRGLRVALVGAPNVGKSTLANALIGRERIVTSDLPGTTRDWVEETAVIAGWPVTLTDTAGARETEDALEAEAIRRGQARALAADLVLMVKDAAAEARNSELGTRNLSLTVWNKCDLLTCPQPEGPTLVSALCGHGLLELEQRIAGRLGLDLLGDDRPAAFLDPQLAALAAAGA